MCVPFRLVRTLLGLAVIVCVFTSVSMVDVGTEKTMPQKTIGLVFECFLCFVSFGSA